MRRVCNRFYRLEILHSWLGWYFRPSLRTVAPMDEGTILVYFCPSTFSLTSPPLPKLNVQYVQTVCVWGGGGLNCAVDHILKEFYTLQKCKNSQTNYLKNNILLKTTIDFVFFSSNIRVENFALFVKKLLVSTIWNHVETKFRKKLKVLK